MFNHFFFAVRWTHTQTHTRAHRYSAPTRHRLRCSQKGSGSSVMCETDVLIIGSARKRRNAFGSVDGNERNGAAGQKGLGYNSEESFPESITPRLMDSMDNMDFSLYGFHSFLLFPSSRYLFLSYFFCLSLLWHASHTKAFCWPVDCINSLNSFVTCHLLTFVY